MATEVRVPVRGEGMEEAVLSEWYVSQGDVVDAGDPLFAIETAKAIYDVESPASGSLLAILTEAGAEVEVHHVVGFIGEPGETVNPADQGHPSSALDEPAEPAPEEMAAPALRSREGASPASPRARAAAVANGLTLDSIEGSGPGGRILFRDVQKARSANRIDVQPVPVSIEASPPELRTLAAVPLSGIRAVIASRMTEVAAIPVVTLNRAANAAALNHLSARMREARDTWGLPRATIGNFVTFVVSRVLPRHPQMNAKLTSEGLVLSEAVHLSIAVDSPQGLFVPVIKNAHTLSLSQISTETTRLAAAVRDRSITPEEMTGATFSLSNLGAWGIESFNPLLNPPAIGILGIGTISPAMGSDGTVVEKVSLSLTFDHRAIDGAPAAGFLRDVAAGIADIDLLMGL